MSEEQNIQTDSMNQQVAEYIDKAWACYSVIDQEKQLKEPTSKRQLKNSIEWLDKAKNLDPKDEQSLQWIHELEDWIKVWKKKHFDGSTTDRNVLIFFIIVTLAVNIYRLLDVISGKKTLTVEGLNQNTIIVSIIYVASALGYFWTNRAPRWLVDKRNRKPRKRISGYIARFSKRQMGATYYTETTYADGHKEKDYSGSFLGPFLGVSIWLLYYTYFFMLLPLHCLLTAIRNKLLYW